MEELTMGNHSPSLYTQCRVEYRVKAFQPIRGFQSTPKHKLYPVHFWSGHLHHQSRQLTGTCLSTDEYKCVTVVPTQFVTDQRHVQRGITLRAGITEEDCLGECCCSFVCTSCVLCQVCGMPPPSPPTCLSSLLIPPSSSSPLLTTPHPSSTHFVTSHHSSSLLIPSPPLPPPPSSSLILPPPPLSSLLIPPHPASSLLIPSPPSFSPILPPHPSSSSSLLIPHPHPSSPLLLHLPPSAGQRSTHSLTSLISPRTPLTHSSLR